MLRSFGGCIATCWEKLTTEHCEKHAKTRPCIPSFFTHDSNMALYEDSHDFQKRRHNWAYTSYFQTYLYIIDIPMNDMESFSIEYRYLQYIFSTPYRFIDISTDISNMSTYISYIYIYIYPDETDS